MLEVLYQDDHLIAFNKPSSMFTHATDLDRKESLNNNLLDLASKQIKLKLYPIHRLDRASSGIVLFAFTSDCARHIQNIWHKDSTRKTYLALVRGTHIGPLIFTQKLKKNKHTKQAAISFAHVLKNYERSSLVEVSLKTGRHHQIRRHFAKYAAHLLGDRTYGKKAINDYYRVRFGLERLFLHAHALEFVSPYQLKNIRIRAPLPVELKEVLKKLS